MTDRATPMLRTLIPISRMSVVREGRGPGVRDPEGPVLGRVIVQVRHPSFPLAS
jgi:hypothetical protein